MTIWKQSPFYPDLGKKVVTLYNKVDPGPSDPTVKIDGFHVLPDRDGNFIEGGEMNYSEDELDAIHTYAIIRMVINMYEEMLGRPIHWSWWENDKGEPLIVKIRNNDINARFIKEYKCIELDYYGPHKNWTFNCRSVDLIAHETGHVILDSILPHLNEGNSESRGIGEAFCDLTAMFWILSQKDLCEEVIRETNGNLSNLSFLTLFGVGYGYEENQYKELRNAINEKKYIVDSKISYDYSKVLVGTLYDILGDLFSKNKSDIKKDDSQNLFLSGQYWMKLIINAFLKDPSTLREFEQNFLPEFDDRRINIKKHFKRRFII